MMMILQLMMNLQFVEEEKPGTFTGMKFSIQVSLVAKYLDRLMTVSVEMSTECDYTMLIRNIQNYFIIKNFFYFDD